MRPFALSLLLLGALLPAAQHCRPGVTGDSSGIGWVLPFADAQQQARDLQRLLLIKPIAFGTRADGAW